MHERASATKLDAAIFRTQARLHSSGSQRKPAMAQATVSAASAALGPEMTLERFALSPLVLVLAASPLEQLIFESLRRCPVPRA